MAKTTVIIDGEASGAVKASEDFSSSLSRLWKKAKDVEIGLDGFSSRADRLRGIWEQSRDTTGKYTEALNKIHEPLDRVSVSGGRAGEAIRKMSRIGADGFRDVALGSTNLEQALVRTVAGGALEKVEDGIEKLGVFAAAGGPVTLALGVAVTGLGIAYAKYAEEMRLVVEAEERSRQMTGAQLAQLSGLAEQLGVTTEELEKFTSGEEHGFAALMRHANQNPEGRIAEALGELTEARKRAAEEAARVDAELAAIERERGTEGAKAMQAALANFERTKELLYELPDKMKELTESTGDATVAHRLLGETFLKALEEGKKLGMVITPEQIRLGDEIRKTTGAMVEQGKVQGSVLDQMYAKYAGLADKLAADRQKEMEYHAMRKAEAEEYVRLVGEQQVAALQKMRAEAEANWAALAAQQRSFDLAGDPTKQVSAGSAGIDEAVKRLKGFEGAGSQQFAALGARGSFFTDLLRGAQEAIGAGNLGLAEEIAKQILAQGEFLKGAPGLGGGANTILAQTLAAAIQQSVQDILARQQPRDEGGRFVPRGGETVRETPGRSGFGGVGKEVAAGVREAFSGGVNLRLTTAGEVEIARIVGFHSRRGSTGAERA